MSAGSVDVATLRRAGTSHVTLTTLDGTFTGRLAAQPPSDGAVTVLFVADGGDPREPLVIDVARITSIALAPG